MLSLNRVLSHSLRAGAGASRQLSTSTSKRVNYWRPRWQHENRGQFWGSEWLRRNVIIESELVMQIVIGMGFFYWFYRKIYLRPDHEMQFAWYRFNGKGAFNTRLEENDDLSYYPRPIRQSEIDDPNNIWHRYRDHIGDFNTAQAPAYDAQSGWCKNVIMVMTGQQPRSYGLLAGPFSKDTELMKKARSYDWQGLE